LSPWRSSRFPRRDYRKGRKALKILVLHIRLQLGDAAP
jgi:hypothetical protein